MSGSRQLSELSDLVEGQRRLEQQLKDLQVFLHEALGAKGVQCTKNGLGCAETDTSLGCFEVEHRPLPLQATEEGCTENEPGLQADGHECADERHGTKERPTTGRRLARASTKELARDVLAHFTQDSTASGQWGSGVMVSACFRSLKAVLRHRRFDYAVGIVIIANTITLGLEIQFSLEGRRSIVLVTLEYLFLACFASEIILRLVVDGLRNFRKAWFYLDVVLVLTGIVGIFLTPATEPSFEADQSFVGFLGNFQLLRILRLLRLLRTLRSIEYFTELWTITIGLIGCFKTVMSAMVLVFVTVYFFSCLAVELIFKSSTLRSDPVTGPIVSSHFDSLPKAMLTLVAFADADSIAGIYAPLCDVQPLLGLFFFSLWLILTISLMNMVAAVIVEKSLAHASHDRELQQRSLRKRLASMVPQIKHIFTQMDLDDTGSLSLEELDFSKVDVPSELQPIMADDKLKDLFEQIDIDHSGDIDETEFIQGICHLALSSVPIEFLQIIQLLRRQDKQLSSLEKQLTGLVRV